MSVVIYRILECNGRTGCLKNTTIFDNKGDIESSETNNILRGQSKGRGWHSTGNYDLCPECYETFFGEEKNGLPENREPV